MNATMFTLRGTWMRGGTSKCWLFNAVDVDPIVDQAGGLDALLASAFGSGDPRQLDGVGGGSSTTSKAAIVRRSSSPGIDVDYLFAQVAIGDRTVEWGSNCGNCATAIGLYALQSGLVPVEDGITSVRMRHTASGAVLTAEIATPRGVIPNEGTATVPGTNAVGVPVGLTFTGLNSTAPLLATGNATDRVQMGGQAYLATLMTAGAPAALFDADELRLDASATIADFAEHTAKLVELRSSAALLMGLRQAGDPIGHAIPKVGIVGQARDYRTTAGSVVRAHDYDISVRMLSMLAPHPAIGLTSAVAIAAAATITEGVVAKKLGIAASPSPLRIGTPAGVLPVDLHLSSRGELASVTLHRAARRIASAELFVSNRAARLVGV